MAFKQPQEYKLVVFGGRDFTDSQLMSDLLFDYANEMGDDIVVSIISGMARGADLLAHKFAIKQQVVCYEMPADWDGLGKRAGFVRNEEMVNLCDGGMGFWDGKSRGTKHMIDTLINLGKSIVVYDYNGNVYDEFLPF